MGLRAAAALGLFRRRADDAPPLATHPRAHKTAQWVAYASDDDAKYSHWDATECVSTPCLEAHARAGMLVDVHAIRGTLEALLPAVLRGESVAALAPRAPWPPRPPQKVGSTGLWWDVE